MRPSSGLEGPLHFSHICLPSHSRDPLYVNLDLWSCFEDVVEVFEYADGVLLLPGRCASR